MDNIKFVVVSFEKKIKSPIISFNRDDIFDLLLCRVYIEAKYL